MTKTAQDWAQQLSALLDRAPSAELLAAASDAALIDLIAATERAKGRLAAAQARAEAAFWTAQIREQERLDVPRGQRGRGIADQVALARRISPKQASDEVALHRLMLETLPRTTALLEAGEINEHAARTVAANVLVLDDEDRERVDADLADRLPTVTARRAGDLARARAQELDPDAAVRRHQRAVADRRVSLRPAVDGMSILRATLPVKDGVAVLKTLTEAAKAATATGDPRTKGQIMADTLTARACGLESADDIPVEIQLLMTDTTLLAEEERTAWIDGHPLPGRTGRAASTGDRPRRAVDTPPLHRRPARRADRYRSPTSAVPWRGPALHPGARSALPHALVRCGDPRHRPPPSLRRRGQHRPGQRPRSLQALQPRQGDPRMGVDDGAGCRGQAQQAHDQDAHRPHLPVHRAGAPPAPRGPRGGARRAPLGGALDSATPPGDADGDGPPQSRAG